MRVLISARPMSYAPDATRVIGSSTVAASSRVTSRPSVLKKPLSWGRKKVAASPSRRPSSENLMLVCAAAGHAAINAIAAAKTWAGRTIRLRLRRPMAAPSTSAPALHRRAPRLRQPDKEHERAKRKARSRFEPALHKFQTPPPAILCPHASYSSARWHERLLRLTPQARAGASRVRTGHDPRYGDILGRGCRHSTPLQRCLCAARRGDRARTAP